MKYKDYYKILGVESNARHEKIKQAFQRLAHKYHPDVSHEPDALERFKEINEAYEVLQNPLKKITTTYNARRYNVIVPYAYAWFITKKNAWMRYHAKIFALKNAERRARFLGITKKGTGVSQVKLQKTIKGSNMKPIQKFPLLLMAVFVLTLSAVTMGVIFSISLFGQQQEYRQIQTAILQGDKSAIETLERSDSETAKKILEGEHVKKAVVHFYLTKVDSPIFALPDIYSDTIEGDILKDEEVYRTLITYYFHKVDVEVKTGNFNQAFLFLDNLKETYPFDKEVSDKYIDIQKKKKQRLAELTQQYLECQDQTLAPLLERTHCMADARQKIEFVGIEHSLPSDSNLPAMYVEETRLALTNKNYVLAERLLLDWKNLLPASSEQRDNIQKRLSLHKQLNSIIADMSGYDNDKIKKRLSQLTIAPALQTEVLSTPQVQNNLVRYYLDEILIIIMAKGGDVNIRPVTMAGLEQVLMVARGESTPLQLGGIPWYTSQPSSTAPDVLSKLQECQAHFDANRLTTGTPSTALVCYQTVLEKNPGNSDALAGLKAIEDRYVTWVKSALQRNQLNKAKRFLSSLKKVNRRSPNLVLLRKRLNEAYAAQQAQSTRISKPKTKPVKAPFSSSICEGCNCSDLLKQMSMGVKPLTGAQRNFFQTQCH
jgi:hypothetical protein